MSNHPAVTGGVGALLTTVLLALPFPYVYAPILGGIVAGGLASDGINQSAKAGVITGLYMVILSIPLLGLAVWTSVLSDASGVTAILRAMEGVGPQTLVFYGVFVWFIAVYSGLTGTLVGSLAGAVKTRIS